MSRLRSGHRLSTNLLYCCRKHTPHPTPGERVEVTTMPGTWVKIKPSRWHHGRFRVPITCFVLASVVPWIVDVATAAESEQTTPQANCGEVKPHQSLSFPPPRREARDGYSDDLWARNPRERHLDAYSDRRLEIKDKADAARCVRLCSFIRMVVLCFAVGHRGYQFPLLLPWFSCRGFVEASARAFRLLCMFWCLHILRHSIPHSQKQLLSSPLPVHTTTSVFSGHSHQKLSQRFAPTCNGPSTKKKRLLHPHKVFLAVRYPPFEIQPS